MNQLSFLISQQPKKKALLFKIPLIVFFFFSYLYSIGQTGIQWKCGSDIMRQKNFNDNPLTKHKNDSIEKAILFYVQHINQQKKLGGGGTLPSPLQVYTIPVVVHIIHNNGPENIPDAQVIAGIQHLNDAFRNVGVYDPTTGVDVEIEFCLAKQDENGNFTTGINRVVSTFTDMIMETDDLSLKNLIRWNPTKYMNIWIVKEITSVTMGPSVVGYAYFPSSHGNPEDGIVNEAYYFGTSPDNSKVTVHEAGHYLGLYHTFQGGCSNNDCLTDGDKVCDTPPDVSTAPVSCSGTINTCTTDDDDLSVNNPFRPVANGGTGDQNDMFIDYMDYGDLVCYSAFTMDQKNRMITSLTGIRNSLLQSIACYLPCTNIITASFTASAINVTAGTTVSFTNTSTGATNYSWQKNGTVFSTAVNSSYTFNTQGTYSVKLIATNNDPACIKEYTITVTVSCPVTASFTSSSSTISPGQNVTFTNTSTGAASYQWYVGNTLQGSSTNFSYTFPIAGSFLVSLIASNGICSTNFYMNVNVGCPPVGEWTWMHGSDTANSLGVTGTQGIAAPANMPPGLYEACEWKDNNGNFWLFGGMDFNGDLWDVLWKYDVTTNLWTWMKGSSTINSPAVYGTQGIPSPANDPGARSWAIISWVDAAGDLWLFGGGDFSGGIYNSNNDLWKYNIATNEWTWMKGANVPADPGSYGTKGIASPTNLPPARGETSCSWTDNAGNLWFYGGYSGGSSFFGDLWKYDVLSNEWTWMHGVNTWASPAVYGVQGVADPLNTPGARWAYSSWKDLTGNLWLFGGWVYPIGESNDLWKYEIASNQWTWMSGTNINDPGNYGTKCLSTNSNLPPARTENRARVIDACGNFWIFGGSPGLNDLWHYNVSTNQWTWVSGDNIIWQPAVFGIKGVSDPANKPPSHCSSEAWIDNNGYIWVQGGSGFGGSRNGLFRYVPDPACVPVCGFSPLSATVTASNVSCGGQCDDSATVNPAGGTPPFLYLWNTTPPQTTQTATGLCVGNYTVSITDAACATITTPVSIAASIDTSVTSLNLGPDINSCNGGINVLDAGSGFSSYLWQDGSSNQNFSVYLPGKYWVTVTKCGNTASDTITISWESNIPVSISQEGDLCAGQSVTLKGDPTNLASYIWDNGTFSYTRDVLTPGTYWLIATDANGCYGQDSVDVLLSDCNCVIAVPTAFSPNNDGHNDMFILHGFENCVTSFSLVVFDRWGEKVFETEDATKGWNGTYKGKPLNSAVFVYYINATLNSGEKIAKKGNISLIR